MLPFLRIVYMNRINSHSRVDEGVTVGSCKINLCFLTIWYCKLASSQKSLQHALDRFSAACNRTGMKVLCLSTNPRQCLLQVSSSTLQMVEKFKHLGVVFASDERWREEIDTRIGKVNAVLRELYRSVVAKRELSNTTTLSAFKSVFVPILTYGRESWVMTERILTQMQVGLLDAFGKNSGHFDLLTVPDLTCVVFRERHRETKRQSVLLKPQLIICLHFGWLIAFRFVREAKIAPRIASTAANKLR